MLELYIFVIKCYYLLIVKFFFVFKKKYGVFCVNDVFKGVYVDLFINGMVSECIFKKI